MASSLFDLMNHAMENTPDADDRWRLHTDADFHKMALLDAIGFIGEALERTQLQQSPAVFPVSDICGLAHFLQSAPELIRGMDALLEAYEDAAMKDPAINSGVCHE